MAYKVIFYNKNIPNSFLISPEVSKIYKGEVGIIDSGGAYFPAFFFFIWNNRIILFTSINKTIFLFFQKMGKNKFIKYYIYDIYNHICCISLV